MKKSLYSRISLFSGVVDPKVEVFEGVAIDDVSVDLSSILNEIFSVDEKTGLPKGDIQYYLSSNGNPQVKEWLELNLLQPRAVEKGSSIEGVTDDLIFEMIRKDDESLEDYASRLASIRDEVLEKPNID